MKKIPFLLCCLIGFSLQSQVYFSGGALLETERDQPEDHFTIRSKELNGNNSMLTLKVGVKKKKFLYNVQLSHFEKESIYTSFNEESSEVIVQGGIFPDVLKYYSTTYVNRVNASFFRTKLNTNYVIEGNRTASKNLGFEMLLGISAQFDFRTKEREYDHITTVFEQSSVSWGGPPIASTITYDYSVFDGTHVPAMLFSVGAQIGFRITLKDVFLGIHVNSGTRTNSRFSPANTRFVREEKLLYFETGFSLGYILNGKSE